MKKRSHLILFLFTAGVVGASNASGAAELGSVELRPRGAAYQELYPGQLRTGDVEDVQIRRALQQAGLDRRTIQALQRDGFPYPRVRQAVEEAALNQGVGRTNARRRGHEVAQRVERLGTQEERRDGRGSQAGQRQPDGWRTAQIRQKLEQVGLPRVVIRALEREGFPPAAVEEQIREWLLDTGYNPASANLRARNLTNQIRTIRRPDNSATGPDAPVAAEAASGHELRLQAARELLRQTGLDRRQIERLERHGFPQDAVRLLVEEQLEEVGYPPNQTKRRAREIARETASLLSRAAEPE